MKTTVAPKVIFPTLMSYVNFNFVRRAHQVPGDFVCVNQYLQILINKLYFGYIYISFLNKIFVLENLSVLYIFVSILSV